jgi:GcvH upstream region-like protein
MLQFFRKHQKIFFIIVTCAVVVSFVFFGTYQAIAPAFLNRGEEEVSYSTQMARFLDTEQWMISRRIFTDNFLNDGVISKEFLETGMAEIVAHANPERFQKDFNERREKEKNYQPYAHPYFPALSATSLWSMFAPDIPKKLKSVQEGKGGFKERTDLFLAQKNFPPAFLSQIIRYQEQNYPHIPGDPRIAREDIALFAYHGLGDWYGEAFIEALAKVIIQIADIARKQGFKVTKEEVLSDLVVRSQEVYKALKQKVDLPVDDGYGLFQLYLRQTGMREQTVLKIWEDVTLFRRLMHAVGDGALVDSFALSQFYGYAYENALVEMVQMTQDVRLTSMDDLRRFEIYLAAVGEKKEAALDIPLKYAPLATIEDRAPELVGKRYFLHYSEISKETLQTKVSVKATLQWQCASENWETLKQQFPELAKKSGDPFEILENLEKKSRQQVDVFSRKKIVEQHPEWIQESLMAAKMNEKDLFLSLKTEKPFEGIKDTAQFVSDLEAKDELLGYTQDDEHYYRFLIKGARGGKEILTYQEATGLKVLDKLSERLKGDVLVKAVVDATPQKYKTEAYAYRFADFIKKYRDELPGQEQALAKQFPIEKKQKTITRSEQSAISLDEALALEKGTFSDIQADPKEGTYLFRFLEKRVDRSIPLDKLVKSQALLSKEARCRYFENTLLTISLQEKAPH